MVKLIEAPKSEKKAHLDRLLTKGMVMVFLDTRRKGVRVPSEHLGNPQLPLNLDYAFQIPDFKVCDDRVEASLSFNRNDFFCVLPFDALYAMRSEIVGEVVVFVEDMPVDLGMVQPDHPSQPVKAAPSAQDQVVEPKPHLVPVPGAKKKSDKKSSKKTKSKKESSSKSSATKKKKSHLRLVKS